MQRKFGRRQWVANAFVAGAVTTLTACGGGGGDGSQPLPAATIDVTAANRDGVAHAAIAAVLALSPTGQVPSAGSAARPARSFAESVALLVRTEASARIAAAAAGSDRARPLAVNWVEACPQGGTITSTFDDRDSSASVSPGDVLTLAYSGCRDTPFVTLDGTVATTYSWISDDRTSFGARATMVQYVQTSAGHALTVNGSMQLDYAVDRVTLTADGPVVASVATHIYADTVTVQSGFAQTAVMDATGGIASSVRGSFASTVIGGAVQLSTPVSAPLVQSPGEEFPHSGVVRAEGRRGTLLTTVLATDTVQLDLDADGDGSFESTSTASWDWLL